MPVVVALLSLMLALASSSAQAQTAQCPPEQFRKVVDDAGAALRKINSDQRPKLEAGLRRLKDKHGWSEDDYADKANVLLSDAKSDDYDVKASELLAKLDQISEQAQAGKAECTRLAELESTALELQATIRVKAQYMLARIEALTAEEGKKQAETLPAAPPLAPTLPPHATPPSVPPTPPAPPKTAAAPPPAPPPQATAPSTTPPPQANPKSSSSWSTSTANAPPPPPKPAAPPARAPERQAMQQDRQTITSEPLPPAVPGPQPPPAVGAPPPHAEMPRVDPAADGFTIDEIKEASRGFFGTISASLGSVIEHSFGKLGRPTAYVLGTEGGGAFFAGVRYGSGSLYTRKGKMRDVYWHGPSIGYDFGASGSKTMFLVYNMHDELDIFAGFSGVDGSAYFVGGVGMTVLTDGKVVMAPIRSGLGFRLGASIGYVRFTPRPTWNPF